MPRRISPRRGTMQYWPRKRAKRIYPRQRFPSGEKGILGFAGWKAGMTHVQFTDNKKNSPTFGKIITKAATVVDAPSLFVCAIRFYSSPSSFHVVGEKWAKVPKNLNIERKTAIGKKNFDKNYDDVRLVVATQPTKSGLSKRKPDIFEIALSGSKEEKKKHAEEALGKEISARDVLKEGEFIDAAAVTKGKGFTGPVKRFGIKIQTRKNEQHHRHVGSIGGVTPRKVDWRVPAAGQHGFHARTEYSKRILLIEEDAKRLIPRGGFLGYGIPKSSILLIEGSVPGPRKRLVRIRKAVRKTRIDPAELKYISVESKQG